MLLPFHAKLCYWTETMMRSSLEVHGELDLIQPNEPWDCNNLMGGYLQASHHYHTGGDLSEFMDHVAKQLSDTSPPTTILDTFHFEPLSPHVDHRPQKVPQRDNNIDITTTNNKRFDQNTEDKGLRMISLLLECAVAISVDNLIEANRMLLELTHMASPYSPSCADRVVAYFTKAMASRVMNSWLRTCSPIVPHKSILTAFQAFNTISPYIKFAHFTANQAILEAFHQKDIVHIVDLDIMHGLQWPALFHILATRPEGPPLVRLTGFGSSMEALEETGRQLSSFAKRLGMSLEFHPVAKRSGDIDPWMVQARRGETMAVHWLQHSLYDATGPDMQTMRLIQLLSPRVITLVEQEMLSCGSFLDRFVGSLHYYSTLFDSLGASLACDDPGRQRVEHGLLGREINNVMAIGGPARSGEDKFVSWRMELAQRGFVPVPMSSNAMAQAQLILNMFPPSLGYMILQGDDGTLRLGWKETGLYTASAWTAPRLLLH